MKAKFSCQNAISTGEKGYFLKITEIIAEIGLVYLSLNVLFPPVFLSDSAAISDWHYREVLSRPILLRPSLHSWFPNQTWSAGRVQLSAVQVGRYSLWFASEFPAGTCYLPQIRVRGLVPSTLFPRFFFTIMGLGVTTVRSSQSHLPRVPMSTAQLFGQRSADHSSLPLRVATVGKNHLNEDITPLLPTGTGERCSQTISIWDMQPSIYGSAELTQGAL